MNPLTKHTAVLRLLAQKKRDTQYIEHHRHRFPSPRSQDHGIIYLRLTRSDSSTPTKTNKIQPTKRIVWHTPWPLTTLPATWTRPTKRLIFKTAKPITYYDIDFANNKKHHPSDVASKKIKTHNTKKRQPTNIFRSTMRHPQSMTLQDTSMATKKWE